MKVLRANYLTTDEYGKVKHRTDLGIFLKKDLGRAYRRAYQLVKPTAEGRLPDGKVEFVFANPLPPSPEQSARAKERDTKALADKVLATL